MTELVPGFLWGASTAPHQVEGNNLNSDFWAREHLAPGLELSGDACDSFGLAIVAAIAEVHHALIGLDSTPGEGTRVDVVFPALRE